MPLPDPYIFAAGFIIFAAGFIMDTDMAKLELKLKVHPQARLES